MSLCSTASLGSAQLLRAAAAIFGFYEHTDKAQTQPWAPAAGFVPRSVPLCRFGVIWTPRAGSHPHPHPHPCCPSPSSLHALRQELLFSLLSLLFIYLFFPHPPAFLTYIYLDIPVSVSLYIHPTTEMQIQQCRGVQAHLGQHRLLEIFP